MEHQKNQLEDIVNSLEIIKMWLDTEDYEKVRERVISGFRLSTLDRYKLNLNALIDSVIKKNNPPLQK